MTMGFTRAGYSDDDEYSTDAAKLGSDYCTPIVIADAAIRTDLSIAEHEMVMALRQLNQAGELMETANQIAREANSDASDARWEHDVAEDAYLAAMKNARPTMQYR